MNNALCQIGATAVMLDSMSENTAEAGYQSIEDQAGSILKAEGGFVVEPSPSERLAV